MPKKVKTKETNILLNDKAQKAFHEYFKKHYDNKKPAKGQRAEIGSNWLKQRLCPDNCDCCLNKTALKETFKAKSEVVKEKRKLTPYTSYVRKHRTKEFEAKHQHLTFKQKSKLIGNMWQEHKKNGSPKKKAATPKKKAANPKKKTKKAATPKKKTAKKKATTPKKKTKKKKTVKK